MRYQISTKILAKILKTPVSLLLFISLFSLASVKTWADDDDAGAVNRPASEEQETPAKEDSTTIAPVPSLSTSSSSPTKKSKGRAPREKEAEGTKAPNRFDAEVIIKSEYKLNGQHLEVDTD